MSEFSSLLENHTEGQSVKDLAMAMGVDPSMISQFTSGTKISCRPDTLMKMVSGISPTPKVQAQLLEAYFRDQCTERYKPWISVRPLQKESGKTQETAPDYGDPLGQLTRTLRDLRLANDVIRALEDIARAIPGRQKFRIVVEDLGTFAREDLLNRSEEE